MVLLERLKALLVKPQSYGSHAGSEDCTLEKYGTAWREFVAKLLRGYCDYD
jgi:hypothetical protein